MLLNGPLIIMQDIYTWSSASCIMYMEQMIPAILFRAWTVALELDAVHASPRPSTSVNNRFSH